jgi:hypothetical protein
MESVEEKLSRAWSMENMDKHKEDIRNTVYVGMCVRGRRVYRVYEDDTGSTWYKTCYVDPITGEILSDEEKIFGKKLKTRRKYA